MKTNLRLAFKHKSPSHKKLSPIAKYKHVYKIDLSSKPDELHSSKSVPALNRVPFNLDYLRSSPMKEY